MKLVIVSKGDPSVGIEDAYGEIELPDWMEHTIDRPVFQDILEPAFRDLFDNAETFVMFEDEFEAEVD